MYPTITIPKLDTWFTSPSKTAVLSFASFIKIVNPRFDASPQYLQSLIQNLQDVADDKINRLMVFMPPRHGKSETISRMFSAYYLYRHPDRFVGINSYAADLAYTLSRNSRDNFTRIGGQLKDDAAAVKHWETKSGGGLWAAGVGGPITGKGFHLGIIDDPVKNAEEAKSIVIQDRNTDWYMSTFYTRAEPNEAIIIIQTRWDVNDLSGWLLDIEEESPEHWHILHYEAIKEELPEYPTTCTIEQDTRQIGEALNPSRYTIDKLNKIKGKLGDYFFGALYQQQPTTREGGMFTRGMFDIVTTVPVGGQYVRYWDKAGTKGAGDLTAGLLMEKVNDTYYIVDLITGQWEAPERERIIRNTAVSDNAKYGHVVTGHEQEPGSGGKESAQNTTRVTLAGFSSFPDKVTGDKVTRAEPLASQAGAFNVKLLHGSWNRQLLDMFVRFPAKPRDGVDAASGAFNRFHRGKRAGTFGRKKGLRR